MARRSLLVLGLATLLATAVAAEIGKQDVKTQKSRIKRAGQQLTRAGLWAKVPKPTKKKPNGLKLLRKPRDLQFAACPWAIDPEERTDEKTYTFQGRAGMKGLEIDSVYIESSLAADWMVSGPPAGHSVGKKQSFTVDVTFKPQETRVSFATLKLKVETRPGGKSRVVTVNLPLIGDGTCPLAADGSGVDIGPVTDPKVKIGAGLDDKLKKLDQEIEICVTAHFVKPKDWDKMTDKQKTAAARGRQRQIDAAIAEANAIWAANNSGIKFKRKGGLRLEDKKGGDEDPHCLDIHFDPSLKKGDGTAHTKGINVNDLPEIPDGLDTDYTDKLIMGESIEVSLDGDAEEVGRTLAHELGHSLGLGSGPDAEDHREPDDYDKKIAKDANADKRMMRHENPGKEMRKIEVELARQVAAHLKATTPQCEKAKKTETGSNYIAPDPRGDVRHATVISRPESVEWRAVLAAPIDARQALNLELELDTDLDSQTDRTLVYVYRDSRWTGESTLPEGAVVQHIWEPRGWEDPSVPEARAVSIEIDRESLPRDYGELGWRIELSVPSLGTTETVPIEGYSLFDITSPSLDISLRTGAGGDGAMRVKRGRPLALRGGIELGPTFSGSVTIRVRFESEMRTVDLDAGTLIAPVGSTWKTTVRVPKNLVPGQYQLTVEAVCEVCRVSDSETVEAIVN